MASAAASDLNETVIANDNEEIISHEDIVIDEDESVDEVLALSEDSQDEVLNGDVYKDRFYGWYKDVYIINSTSKDIFTLYPNSVDGNLTVHVNGKKYTGKTNAKGVVKVTVKKNVLKKLKVGKKVKIQVTYGKTTKNLNVKVSK